MVRVLRGLLGVVLLGDDQRRLDDAVLHRLGERVVADRPGEVHAVLVLGRGGEVEPERETLGQRAVDGEQRLAPGEVLVVDVVRLVVEHHEVLERLDPLQHRALARGARSLTGFLPSSASTAFCGVHSWSRDS